MLYLEYHDHHHDQANILPRLFSIPKTDTSPSQPTHLGPSVQPLDATILSQSSSTEHGSPSRRTPARVAGRPHVVGQRSQRRRRLVRDSADEIARGGVQLVLCGQLVSRLPTELIRSVPPVSQITSPSNQSPNSCANQHTPSHLPVKQDNPLNPDFPGLSSGTHARHDAALGACLCCLTASLGMGRRVPPRARARGGGWPRTGGLLEGAGRPWCYGRGGACVVEVVMV